MKLLNSSGEFLSSKDGKEILEISEKIEKSHQYSYIDNIGKRTSSDIYADKHIELIKNLKLVDIEAIKKEAGIK